MLNDLNDPDDNISVVDPNHLVDRDENGSGSNPNSRFHLEMNRTWRIWIRVTEMMKPCCQGPRAGCAEELQLVPQLRRHRTGRSGTSSWPG